MRRGHPEPARVRGGLAGATVDARGTIALGDDAVVVGLEMGTVALPYATLDGVSLVQGALVLSFGDGTTLAFESLPDAAAVAGRALDLGQRVPEVTRGLRGFASVSATPGSDHDVFFAPLVAARRAAHLAGDPEARRDAFDPQRLRAALDAAAADLARRRFPADADAGDRRALEAELDELLGPVRRALDALALASTDLAAAPGPVRFTAWRRWCVALESVFEAADGAWLAALPVLADSRGAQGALWRRVLRGGHRGGSA